MSTHELAAERLRLLIAKGRTVLTTEYKSTLGAFVASDGFSEWQSQSLTFLRNLLPEKHTYVERFVQQVDKPWPTLVQRGVGILRALLQDLEGGYLTDLKTLITAEVFHDFLDMAAHLIDLGYKDPAAMLTGAVLEDGLRRMAGNAGATLNRREDLTTLSQKCLDAGLYNRLAFKQIEVWKELRNKADHGEFHEYTLESVAEMHQGVTGFLATHLR